MAGGMTIALLEGRDSEPVKVTKIIGYKDGFGVLVPYTAAREGWAAKIPVDYRQGTANVAAAETQAFTAEDRVKFSYHADGFAQFSGENPGAIRSGRDERGQPKGLAVQTWPHGTLIETGPTFAIQLWGLNGFQRVHGGRNSTWIFDERDYLYRDCGPDDWDSYVIEGFLFTGHFRPHVRIDARDRIVLPLWHRAYEGGKGGQLDFRIVQEHNSGMMVAVLVSRTRIESESECGFILNGPSDIPDDEGKGAVLMAQYPPPKGIEELELPALDYTPER